MSELIRKSLGAVSTREYVLRAACVPIVMLLATAVSNTAWSHSASGLARKSSECRTSQCLVSSVVPAGVAVVSNVMRFIMQIQYGFDLRLAGVRLAIYGALSGVTSKQRVSIQGAISRYTKLALRGYLHHNSRRELLNLVIVGVWTTEGGRFYYHPASSHPAICASNYDAFVLITHPSRGKVYSANLGRRCKASLCISSSVALLILW